MGIIILLIAGIAAYFLFKEMKKDYEKELNDIRDENRNLE